MKPGKKIVLDPGVRYINLDLDFEKLLVYELAPYPTSFFNEK